MKIQITQTLSKIKIIKKGITGSTLKMIAIVSMLIDHIGVIILDRALISNGMLEVVDKQSASVFLEANGILYYTYTALRVIGRIAFPIFCFLSVEGFLHTGNLKKYLRRMILFAIISEIPFDLAFYGVPFYWGHQNVFLTLFLGILTIAGVRLVERKTTWNIACRVLLCILIITLGLGSAYILKTDYNIAGILTIVLIYLLRRKKILGVGLGCVPLKSITSFVSLVPIYLYNGKRGRNIKWFFYLFYPIHILFLYLISCALGLGQVPLNV